MIEAVNLRKTFAGRGGLVASARVTALREVAFRLEAGGVAAVIGESGSGKTTLGRIIAGLEPFDSGTLAIGGDDVGRLGGRERAERFQRVQLIHQDPYAALNPTRTIEETLTAVLKVQAGRTRRPASWVAGRRDELLEMVGLNPHGVLGKYPHELSGGQRQRVVIARALTVDPSVLVADEAVSMIDVSLRLGILQLLGRLRAELGLGLVFITHDVAVARYIARGGEICVLYRGEVVERGATDVVLNRPMHPYTQALLSAVPVMHGVERGGRDRFIPLRPLDDAGDVGEEACGFSPRCPFARDRCRVEHPELMPADGDSEHVHSCFFAEPRQVIPVPA